MLRNSGQVAVTGNRLLRCLASVADTVQLSAHEAGVPRASSQAWDFAPREACLAGTRGVLRLAGADLIHFMQGLVTNDVGKLLEPAAKPLYACMLNAQGRFLHDMFLSRQPGGEADGVILADVDAASLPDIVKLLRRYKLRAAVDVADVSEEEQVWTRFGAQPQRQPGGSAQPSEGWFLDPRLPELGGRAVLPGSPPSAEGAAVIYAREYRSWRIEHGVAEGDREISAGEAIPLEYNMDGLNAISFSKGCYVGQELVARTHFRGMVRKRLMPLVLVPHAGMDIGHAIEAAEGSSKRPVGTLRVLNQGSGRGLALLRLSEGLALARGEHALRVKERPSVSCATWRPAWWPSAWGADEVPPPQTAD